MAWPNNACSSAEALLRHLAPSTIITLQVLQERFSPQKLSISTFACLLASMIVVPEFTATVGPSSKWTSQEVLPTRRLNQFFMANFPSQTKNFYITSQ